jgi:hypothetical protein
MNIEPNPNLLRLLKRMAEIKSAFLDGVIDKAEATRQVDATLHENGLLHPEEVMTVEDVPEDFFLPCDCLICKSERGETPLPLEAIISIENLRMAWRVGMIPQYNALLEIRRILAQYKVTDEEALKLWNIKSSHQTQVTPLADEEKAFFSGLEEQMKDIPKE